MTDYTTATPGWMTPGNKVIVAGGNAGNNSMGNVAIKKITKTQIVLANGTRFSRRDLRAVGRSAWDTSRILDPDQPSTDRVWREYQQKALRDNLGHRVGALLEDFSRSGDVTHAEQALDTLAAAVQRYKDRAAKIAESGSAS